MREPSAAHEAGRWMMPEAAVVYAQVKVCRQRIEHHYHYSLVDEMSGKDHGRVTVAGEKGDIVMTDELPGK